MDTLKKLLEWGGRKRDIVSFCILSAAALILSLLQVPFFFSWAWIAVVLCGVPIILEAIIGLVTERGYQGGCPRVYSADRIRFDWRDFAAGEVAFIMQLGGLLEDLTVSRARAGIERLVHLTPRTARVITGDREQSIPAEEVAVGDILRVLPGRVYSGGWDHSFRSYLD